MNLVMKRVPVLPIVDGYWISGGKSGLRWWISGVGIALMLLVGLMVTRLAADPVRFPVAQVDVVGTLDFADRGALRDRIKQYLGASFYALDIDGIRSSLETMPWVDAAHVRRIWPDRLLIDVVEHEPAARWNDQAMISQSMTVFKPAQLRADHERHLDWLAQLKSLPRLFGAEGRHEPLLAAWQQYSTQLDAIGLQLERLSEDARLSQTLSVAGSITVRLGYSEQAERLSRFTDVFERLQGQLQGQPARFDMRYPHGFALAGASSAQEGS